MELKKGQKIKLGDLSSAKQLEFCTSVRMKTGETDICCFGVDERGMLSDDRYFVFYNQAATPEGAITMKADAGGTCFTVNFDKLPAFLHKLVITVSVDGMQTMGDIADGSLAVLENGRQLASFLFDGANFKQEKAVILCEIYKKDNIWRLSVVASGFNGGLSALLAHFGGEEVKPASPEPAQKSQPNLASISSSAAAPAPVPPGPSAPAPAPSGPINLKKSGDSHKISLSKQSNNKIHVNLKWNTEKRGLFGPKVIDLDLACMYRLKSGEQGVIQALGNTFGSSVSLPFIQLDQDDRTGSSKNGENMFFTKPELIDFAVVFAYIYEGTPNWQNTGAWVVLKQQGAQDIEIHIDNSSSNGRFCVIASLTGERDQLVVRREEQFFPGHREVDQHYGFGFRWQAGRK